MRMRDSDREPRPYARVVRTGGKARHDLGPCLTGVGALVHRVAPEGGVENVRVLRIYLEVGGARRLRRLPQQVERLSAVGRLPDPETGVCRDADAPLAAAAAEDRD